MNMQFICRNHCCMVADDSFLDRAVWTGLLMQHRAKSCKLRLSSGPLPSFAVSVRATEQRILVHTDVSFVFMQHQMDYRNERKQHKPLGTTSLQLNRETNETIRSLGCISHGRTRMCIKRHHRCLDLKVPQGDESTRNLTLERHKR